MPPEGDDNKEVKDDKDKKSDDSAGGLTGDQIKQALQYLVQRSKAADERFETLEKQLKERDNTAHPPSSRASAKSGDDDDDEVDIESLDNAGLVKHIVGEVGKMLKPVHERLQGVNEKGERTHATLEVKEAAGRYSDFVEFRDEIELELKRNPNLTVDDAYHLAKGRNPDKAEAISKAALEAKEKEENERKEKESPPYGGLLPTSTVGKPSQKMVAEDAANAAWEKEMAGFESQLSGNA